MFIFLEFKDLALYASWADAGITPDCPEPTPAHLKARLWSRVVDGWIDQLAA